MSTKVDTIKNRIEPVLREYDVKKASVFGSFATGEDSSESDIDVLIELGKNRGLFTMAKLQRELENKLGRKIDLLTYNSVHPQLQDRIYKEMIQIYGQEG